MMCRKYIPAQMSRPAADPRWSSPDAAGAIGIVDAGWCVQHVSIGVLPLLGLEPSAVIGRHLEELVHPAERAELLMAVGGALEAPRLQVAVVRLRCADDRWQMARVLVSALADSLSFAFFATAADPSTPHASSDRLAELCGHLRQIAGELQSARALSALVSRAPGALERFPELAELPGRQSEVLLRLLSGERVPTIAREMFLSQKTVRNHLSAIYARLEVHSQREVLELFARRRANALTSRSAM